MSVKQVIVVRKDLNMRKGKIAAQVAHAAMKFLVQFYDPGSNKLERMLNADMVQWLSGSFTKVVVYCESEQELVDLIDKAERRGIICHSVVDAGRTEFHGVPTLTCAAFGPDESDNLDAITGKLSLL